MQLVKLLASFAILAICQGHARGRWGQWGARANSKGRSLGGHTSINTRSDVNNNGYGSKAFSSGSGSAIGRGRTAVDLASQAGVNGKEGRSLAGGSAYGNRVSSSAGANAVEVSYNRVAVGASGAGSSVSTRGTGSARSYAVAEDNWSSVRAQGRGRGVGDLVVSGSQSGAGLLNSRGTGKASGFSRASGRGHSASESAARYRRD